VERGEAAIARLAPGPPGVPNGGTDGGRDERLRAAAPMAGGARRFERRRRWRAARGGSSGAADGFARSTPYFLVAPPRLLR
jgi:hypothetical protein